MTTRSRFDDLAVVVQWVMVFILIPFILFPVLDERQISMASRVLVVSLMFAGSAAFTLAYLWARKRSERASDRLIAYIAAFDVSVVLLASLTWPGYTPDLFWVLTLMVLVIASRFGYAITIGVTLTLCALFTLATLFGKGDTIPIRSIVNDSIFRTSFLTLIAVAVAYVTKMRKRELSRVSKVSDVASKVSTTLDADEVLTVAARATAEVLPAKRAMVFTLDSTESVLHYRATINVPEGLDEGRKDIPIEADLYSVISGLLKDSEIFSPDDNLLGVLATAGLTTVTDNKNFLLVPFATKEGPGPFIVVELREAADKIGEDDLGVLNSIAWLASAAHEKCLKYREEQRRRELSDNLYSTLRKLGSSINVSDVAHYACQMVIDGMGARGCSLFVLDERKEVFHPVFVLEASGFFWGEFSSDNDIPVQEVEKRFQLAAGDILFVDHPESMEVLPAFLRAEGVLVIAPFYQGSVVGGLICVADEKGKSFTDEEISRLRVVASEAGLAISNARLHDKVAADAAQLASLMQLTNAIGSTTNLGAIMTLALDTAKHLFDCSCGLIYRIDDTGGFLRYVDSFGYPPEVLARIVAPPYLGVSECPVAATGRMLNVENLSGQPGLCKVLRGLKGGSSVCVVLRAGNRNLGILHLRRDSPGGFAEEDLKFIMAIADQVSIAIQRGLLFEEISRLAITDPLTGVYNVRRLDAALKDEFSRATRYRRPFSFLMIDVDNLKAWNDSLGHLEGDVVLSQIASILDTNTRDVDKVFRYGGDEFCILLPETDVVDAKTVAEKLRKAVSDFSFPGEEKLPGERITVSVGVASLSGAERTPDELVRKADKALYMAKRRGRDTVYVHRGELEGVR